MSCLSMLLLFGFFVVLINSRPSQSGINDESDEEETEYGSDDKALAEDSADEDSRLNEDSSGRDLDQRLDLKNPYSYHERNLGGNRADRSHSDFSDYKPNGRDVRNDKSEENNNYEDIQNYGRRSSGYTGNEDASGQKETAQYLNNRDIKYSKSNRIHNNIIMEEPLDKREVDLKQKHNKPSDSLFGFNADQSNQVNGNNINSETNELSQHYSKYYQINPDNKEPAQCKSRDGDHLYFNRDRRETENSNEDLVHTVEKNQESVNSDESQNEDEETVIRKHIKNLSSDELDELLSSLSEEKRILLKSIIGESDHAADTKDSVNKREITKKAGAAEENSCVESEQADSNNIHGDSSVADVITEAPAQSTEAAEVSKQTDSSSEKTDLSNSKSTETNPSNKVELTNQNDNAVQQQSDDDAPDIGAEKTHVQIIPNEHVTTKNDNKRETNINDLADIVSFDESKMEGKDWITGDSKDQQECYNSHDDELSQFLDDEQSLADDSKIYKRNAEKQADYDSQMKSLEESFPKSQTYDESAGPLIRVKRKNSEPLMKKRSAAKLPDAKVAFFPSENDDEDNDEGNEFDDDGFYDRNPNLSGDDANNPKGVPNCKSAQSANDLSKGTMSIGSDTDNVLSGVEGVDENLMFSSGSRNRRTTEDVSDVDDTNVIQSADSKSLSDENKAVSDMNALTYHETDSFGPLPRYSEGESGRYKRIRRVKQSHADVTPSDS